MTLSSLIEKMEAAGEGSRELDALVWLYFDDERNLFIADDGAGVRYKDFERQNRHIGWERIQNYTRSIDAVYRLICATLPGYGFILREDDDGCYGSLLYPVHNRVTPGCMKAATPPLALLAALLKALQAAPSIQEGTK